MLLAFLVVFYPLLLIHVNTRRMPIPAVSVEFPYPLEPLTLRSRDGLQLAAWRVDHPTPERGTLVLLHGHTASKEFSLERGVFAYREGFDLLLLDFRNHGGSEGHRTTFGGREWMDVLATVEYARRDPSLSDDVVLWGCSQGAAAALLAAEQYPALRAVIAESSFSTLEDAFERYAKRAYRIPRVPFVSLSLFWFQMLTDVDIEAVNPARAVRNSPQVPILFVGSEQDRFMPPEVQQELYSNSAHPDSALWLSPRGAHAMIYVVNGKAYQQRVKDFLSQVERASGSPEGKTGENLGAQARQQN
jgi:pimeloyl-ACP methyl ester carboxylesterase